MTAERRHEDALWGIRQRRDPEQDLQCADCLTEPGRLRTVDGRTVCDPECAPVDVAAVLAAHVEDVKRACDPDRKPR